MQFILLIMEIIRELSPLNPYNNYGKTKLKSEKIVNKLGNYLIVRTRFFDKKN